MYKNINNIKRTTATACTYKGWLIIQYYILYYISLHIYSCDFLLKAILKKPYNQRVVRTFSNQGVYFNETSWEQLLFRVVFPMRMGEQPVNDAVIQSNMASSAACVQ